MKLIVGKNNINLFKTIYIYIKKLFKMDWDFYKILYMNI